MKEDYQNNLDELAELIMFNFNKTKEGILDFEKEVQNGYDYSLAFSVDGSDLISCEWLSKEVVHSVLESENGYVIGFYETDGYNRGYDRYDTGSECIEHYCPDEDKPIFMRLFEENIELQR